MRAMLDDPHKHQGVHEEPQPRFASDAEIALAGRLRQQIEERYLGAAAPASGSATRALIPH